MKTNEFRELLLPGPRPPLAARSARLPDFMGMGAGAARRLDRLRVLLVGCGAVGRVIAEHLARLGVGTLWLADRKRYKPESLLTQPIRPSEVGGHKALLTARVCKGISPRTRVLYLTGSIQSAGWAELAEADLAISAADNLETYVEMGEACFRLGIPMITAAVHGESLVAQVKVFSHSGEDDPCVMCQLGSGERAALNAQVEFSCDGAPILKDAQPTRSTSSLCSLGSSLVLNAVLRRVLGLGREVSNELLQYCGYTNLTQVTPLVRRPSCPADHCLLRRVRLRRSLCELTPAEAVRLAGLREGAAGAVLVAGGLEWVQAAFCSCPTPRSVNRFVRPDLQGLGRCRHCGRPLRRGTFHTHSAVPLDLLGPRAGVPLRALGAGSVRWLTVRANGTGAWISTQEKA